MPSFSSWHKQSKEAVRNRFELVDDEISGNEQLEESQYSTETQDDFEEFELPEPYGEVGEDTSTNDDGYRTV